MEVVFAWSISAHVLAHWLIWVVPNSLFIFEISLRYSVLHLSAARTFCSGVFADSIYLLKYANASSLKIQPNFVDFSRGTHLAARVFLLVISCSICELINPNAYCISGSFVGNPLDLQ